MANIPLLKASGLYTSSNEIGSVPEGALTDATNVVIRSKDLVEPRRGQGRVGAEGTSGVLVRNIFSYGDTLFTSYKSGSDYGIAKLTGSTLDGFATTLNPPDPALMRMKSFEAKQSLYVTTSEGIYKFDDTTSEPIPAGVPAGTMVVGYAQTLAASGAIPPEKVAAYRFVFGIRDASGRVLLGAPSSRHEVVNASATDFLSRSFYLIPPSGLTSDYFVQTYRTLSVPDDQVPTEDYYLVNEEPVTMNDVGGTLPVDAVIVSTDVTPDEAVSQLGYFSANDQGLSEANDEPPCAKDAVVFGSRVLYANTKLKHQLTLRLLGTDYSSSGTGGIKEGDKLVVGGSLLNAELTENVVDRNFEVFDASTLGMYDAIVSTANSIAKVQSLSPFSTLNADTRPFEDDTPGNIYFEASAFSDTAFAATADDGSGNPITCFSPALPTSGTAISSTNEEGPNRIYWSKRDIPEAVPRKNYLTVGAENKQILRMIAVRDRVFVFKEDGLFMLSGEAPYRVTPLDPTVKLVSPDSVVAVSNQVFALTTQGVVAVTEAGAVKVSKGIERELTRLINEDNFSAAGTFGVAYESEGLYLLGMSLTNSERCDFFYAYNVNSGAWSKWDLSRTCGYVSPTDDVLYTGHTTRLNLYSERKSFTSLDYHDDEYEYEVDFGSTSADGTGSLGLLTSTEAEAGDVWSVDGQYFLATSESGILGPPNAAFSPGSVATLHKAYLARIEWAAKAPGGGDSALIREVQAHLRDRTFYRAQVGMRTNLSSDVEYKDVAFPDADDFFADYGTVEWGEDKIPSEKRVGVSPDKQRAKFYRASFRTQEAGAMWSLQGLTLIGEQAAAKGSK